MKKLLFGLMIFAMLIAACGGEDATSTPEPAAPEATKAPEPTEEPVAEFECTDEFGCVTVNAGEKLRLATALVISGPNETLGIDSQRGVEIAVDDRPEVLGFPVELVHEDGQCSAEGGQTAATKITSDETIVAVVGHNCSSSCVPAAPIYEQAGFTMMSPSCTAVSLTVPETHVASFTRTAHSDKAQGGPAADFAFDELGARKAATIHDGSPYAEQLQQVFAERFRELGGEITAQEAVNVGDTDMRPLLTSIAVDAPDIIYYPIFIAEGGFITTQAKEIAGLEDTYLMGADGMQSPDFVEAAGDAGEGMYFSGPQLALDPVRYEEFKAKHEAKYGEDPLSVFHSHAYDAANIIFDAIEKVGVIDAEGNLHIGRKALRDAIYATQGFKGLTGSLNCDENGDCADPAIIVSQIQMGEYVPIWSAAEGVVGEAIGPGPAPEGELAEGCTEDLTGETITLYHFGDLSNVYGFITQPLLAGLTDAVAYYNDQGGICGATIASEFADDGLNMEESQAIYDRFTAADPPPFMYLLYGSPETELLRSQLAEDQIPAFTAGVSTLGLYGESGQEPSWAFANVPPYADQVGLFCEWVSETWDKEDPPKLAHLSWAGAFGEAAATEESTAYCESLGVEVVGAEYFAPGTPDLTAQIQSLMAEGANILWTNALATGPVQVLNDAIALGERENLMIAGPNWALDTSVIGLGGAASNGLIGILPYVWWDETDHPGIQLVTQQWLANEREIATRNIAYLLAWGTLDTYIELLKTAIADVGYENLDGSAVKAAMEKLDYSSLDGVFDWTFSEEIRAPNKARIGQISFTADGTPQILPLTDWSETPDLRPGGADVP